MDHKTFLDDLVHPIYKRGEELTPGGQRKYSFWFGRYKEYEAFALWKFSSYKTIDKPPECVVTTYTLRDFVKVAKELGLHISKAEKEQLSNPQGES